MTDSLVPTWIKNIKAQREAEENRSQVASQRYALASKILLTDGPAFWKQFLKDLQITVDSLPLIGLRASMADLGGKSPRESVQISIVRESLLPAQLYTNLYYDAPGSNIRCFPQVGSSFELQFGFYGDRLMVSCDDSGPMNPEQAAEYIIHAMVEKIELA